MSFYLFLGIFDSFNGYILDEEELLQYAQRPSALEHNEVYPRRRMRPRTTSINIPTLPEPPAVSGSPPGPSGFCYKRN